MNFIFSPHFGHVGAHLFELLGKSFAGERLVDFVDLNVSEVVFFRYRKRAPVVVALKCAGR